MENGTLNQPQGSWIFNKRIGLDLGTRIDVNLGTWAGMETDVDLRVRTRDLAIPTGQL